MAIKRRWLVLVGDYHYFESSEKKALQLAKDLTNNGYCVNSVSEIEVKKQYLPEQWEWENNEKIICKNNNKL